MTRKSGGEIEIDDIVSAAVYDLQTPLTLIRGLNDLMASGRLSKKRSDLFIARIATSVEQMQRIIDTISNLDSIINQQELLPIEPVNMRQIVDDVAHRLSGEAKDYDQRLIVKHGRRSAIVLSQRKALETIVYGLVDSAIRYSSPDSDILIRPSATSRTGYARLTVRDRTVGVRKGDIDRVMHSLGRASSPNPAHGSSSGLGLYSTIKLIDWLNGFVGVKPVPGGSSFFVEIPLAQQLSLDLPKP